MKKRTPGVNLGGRPKKTEGEVFEKTIGISVSCIEYESMRLKAKELGYTSLSAFLRSVFTKALLQSTTENGLVFTDNEAKHAYRYILNVWDASKHLKENSQLLLTTST